MNSIQALCKMMILSYYDYLVVIDFNEISPDNSAV